jgi:NADH dehydrogenase FAD-containing subunit
MVSQQKEAMIDKSAPNPSVEAILHAIIPFKYVDHTHSDAVVTISNTDNGLENINEVYPNYLVIKYVMPGFILAQTIYNELKHINWDTCEGIILLNHGIFTFDNDPKISYEKMIDGVTKAEEFLEQLGVQVWKNVRVTGYNGKTVTTKTDLTFETATLVWAAGVKGATIKGLDAKDLLASGNRLNVNEFNQVLGYPEIFALGDIACMQSIDYPRGHPMMAQPAIQQGENLGDNIVRLINDEPFKPFIYKDKGSMATVGRNKAVVDLKNIKFQGVFAWFVWMFVHLFFLIGFRNRVVVFVNWVYNYIRFDREARLIIRPYKRNYSQFKD